MKRVAVLGALIALLAVSAPIVDANHQSCPGQPVITFYDGVNQTGNYRVVCADDAHQYSFLTWNWQNVALPMDNRISSLSMYQTVTGWRIVLYTGYDWNGSSQTFVDDGGGQFEKFNLNATLNNASSSYRDCGTACP